VWILTQHRAFLRNPVQYPDAENFRPERWLQPGWPTYQEPLTQFPTIKGLSSFGWGQRQCLGMTLTQDELVIACGALMWCFNLKPKVDPLTGQELPVPLDKSNSLLIIKPDPFQMAFEPRSEERKQQALRQWQESEEHDLRQRADFTTRTARAPQAPPVSPVSPISQVHLDAKLAAPPAKAKVIPVIRVSDEGGPGKVSHWIRTMEIPTGC